MSAHTQQLPFGLAQLIAEAKWRMRRRRVLVALILSVLIAGVAAALTSQSASGPARTPASKLRVQAPRQTTSPPRISSISVIHESLFGGAIFMGVNNMWQGRVGRVWVLAYAGMHNNDPSSGGINETAADYEPALALWTEPTDPNAEHQYVHLIGVYRAPGSEATVKIVAANRNVLRLVTLGPPGAARRSLRFNLLTHAYSR